MEQSKQQDQNKQSGQGTQTEDKQNMQKMNKSGSGANQGGDGMSKGMDKTGQKEDSDVDERTNVDQRSGDYQGGAQKQASGKGSTPDQTGHRGVESSAKGTHQPYDTDNDQDIESDKNSQSGRTGQMDKKNQKSSDSDKDSNRPTGNKGNPSK